MPDGPRQEERAQSPQGRSVGKPGWSLSEIGGGVLAPIILALIGLRACLTRQATLPGRCGSGMGLTGAPAVALGVAIIAIGLHLHFACFWSVSARLYRWAGIGKVASLLAFLGALGYVGWRVAMA